MDAARGIKSKSFKIDENYQPLTMSPSREKDVIINDDEKGVIIRGVILENKIKELEAEPIVIKVWKDSKLDFFPCPIPPCDCHLNVPKGSLTDVATYLGVDYLASMGIRGQGIVVGIVDSGINAASKPQRIGTKTINNVIGGWPTSDWGTISRGDGHGNMIATDVLGIAPDAQLYDIRVSGDVSIPVLLSNAMSGIQWAIDQHKNNGTPHILTNSWGIYQENEDADYATNKDHPLTQRVIDAINEGILVLFAAGNCGQGCPLDYCGNDVGPGKSIWGANGHHRVMTVGAANINEQFVGYSSQGPAALDPIKPDFCSITHFTGFFPVDNGTSAAAPIAAGVIALLKQCGLYLTQDQIKQALKETATDIGPNGWDSYSGAGIINAIAAWHYLFPTSGGSGDKGPSDQIAPKKIKVMDDGLKHVGDNIRLPGENVTNPPIRGLSRSRNHNAPFVLATPHHSMEWVKRSRTSYGGSYEELLSEYELAIARLQEQLEYLQNEYHQIRNEYNKKLSDL